MSLGAMRQLCRASSSFVRPSKCGVSPTSQVCFVAPISSCFFLSAPVHHPDRRLVDTQHTDTAFSKVWIRPSPPRWQDPFLNTPNDGKPPDERTLNLGKTIRILHERLPTLLANPLPQEILSPQITLHLFPSTHPHLPTVTGRIAYIAALWTAPVAWGRVPVVGNVKLIILSERMIRSGSGRGSQGNWTQEKLIVRWKTCGKTKGKGMGVRYRGIGASEQVDKITEFLGGDARDDEEFCGLFIFEFDELGRIARHTIEHAEEGRAYEKMPKLVNVTDWLLGKARGKDGETLEPGGLALCEINQRRDMRGRRME